MTDSEDRVLLTDIADEYVVFLAEGSVPHLLEGPRDSEITMAPNRHYLEMRIPQSESVRVIDFPNGVFSGEALADFLMKRGYSFYGERDDALDYVAERMSW